MHGDPVQYSQSCQTLMDNLNSLVFRDNVSHNIEDITKVLNQMARNFRAGNLLKYFYIKKIEQAQTSYL